MPSRIKFEEDPSTSAISRRDFLGSTAGGVAGLALASDALGQPQTEADPTTRPGSPLAMWALTGTLKSADVQRQLDAYRKVGWGVVLYPRWGLELEYLREMAAGWHLSAPRAGWDLKITPACDEQQTWQSCDVTVKRSIPRRSRESSGEVASCGNREFGGR